MRQSLEHLLQPAELGWPAAQRQHASNSAH
jgi:hypothetical protein